METPQKTERKRKTASQILSNISIAKEHTSYTEMAAIAMEAYASQEVTLAIKEKDENIERLYQVTIAQMNRIKQLEECILNAKTDLHCFPIFSEEGRKVAIRKFLTKAEQLLEDEKPKE